jgi:hypothetical protein
VRKKRALSFAARLFHFTAPIMLLIAASGCGLDGPAPTGRRGGGENQGAAPASAATSASNEASTKNLRAIGQAMQNYASTFSNAFPPSASTRNGKPYCSWRVKILPFLDEGALYKQYHMNEPWDSPHNLELAKTTPKVYQTPGRPDDGKTCYMVFAGKGAPLDGGNNVPLMTFQDGLANTILVVEAGSDKAVPWTKPEDLPFDQANPIAALGQIPGDGFLATTADGRVHRFNVDNSTLKALITPAGNEKIDMRKITGR